MAPVFNSAIVNVTFGAVSVKPSAVMLFENITSGDCRIKFADVFAIEKKSNAASREAIPPPPPVSPKITLPNMPSPRAMSYHTKGSRYPILFAVATGRLFKALDKSENTPTQYLNAVRSASVQPAAVI